VQDILTVKEQLNAYRGTEHYKDVFNDSKKQREMFGVVKVTETRLRKLRKMRKMAEARGDKKRVETLNKQMQDIQAKFNNRYRKKLEGK
jgi:copper homeostasis protein CutC